MMRSMGATARGAWRVAILVSGVLAAGCSAGGSSAPSSAAPPLAPPPIDASFVAASNASPLGADPNARLDALSSGARAGTLLARSGDGGTCVFADGRDGWNRAAC